MAHLSEYKGYPPVKEPIIALGCNLVHCSDLFRKSQDHRTCYCSSATDFEGGLGQDLK